MRLPITLFLICFCTSWQTVYAVVCIEGISDALESNVLAHMRLDEETCEADPVKVRYRFDRASDAIRAALRPFGYYEPDVQADLIQPESGCWEAVFQIDPGEPITLRSVRIEVLGEGENDNVFRQVVANTELRVGEVLHHADYELTKNQLLIASREYGFFDAEMLASELQVDLAAKQADVQLVLQTGSRYRFGDLHIEGNIVTENLLLRYVDFEPGAPFEQRRIRKLHNDLIRGDFFSSVDARTRLQENNIADIVLTLEEGRRIRYGIGAGFGTDTGIIVRGDAVHRRLNRHGHRLELDAEASKVRQNITADYRIPGKRPQSDWYSLYTGFNREDTDALESVSWKFGVRENRFHTVNWNSTPFAEFVVESFRQDGEWTEKLSLVPGWGIKFIDANAPSRPTRGLRLTAEVAGASKEIVSDASFIRFQVSGKTILPVSERGRLIIRGEAGWMATDDFDKVPPTWRFFAGGDRSVRGFDYQSLGPTDDEGKAIGGRKLLTGSIEGDWRFRERWSGALFVDAGNVGEEDLLKSLPWGIGFGVRWYSPVGPIRLDLAFPQEGGNDFRVHISMGPDL